jgi:hypothetical protein
VTDDCLIPARILLSKDDMAALEDYLDLPAGARLIADPLYHNVPIQTAAQGASIVAAKAPHSRAEVRQPI